jgi:cardiolipin synthase
VSLTAAIAGVIRGGRRLGIPAFADNIPEREVDSYAYSMAYTAQARLWMLRTRAASWPCLHEAWRRSLEAGSRAVRAELSGTLEAGDQIQLLDDGRAVLATQAELYAGATRTIDIATYYIQADDAGWNTARLLQACAQRGVRVRFVADRHMMTTKRHEIDGMDELLEFLRRASVEVRLWHDPERPFDRNHRKMIVVDAAGAVVGGRNFANHYQDGSWRDIELVLRGPTARGLAPVFEGIWSDAAPRSTRAVPPWFGHIPARVERDPTVRYVLACIEAAERTLDLELAYFVGGGPLSEAIAGAARRGVRVRLRTNSAESTDMPFTRSTTAEGVRTLLEAGAQVLLRRGTGRTLHCKYMVADGEWVSFGSHNLDRYSSRFNCELNLHVHSAELGHLLTGFFEKDRAGSTPADRQRDVDDVLARTRGLRRLDWIFREFH